MAARNLFLILNLAIFSTFLLVTEAQPPPMLPTSCASYVTYRARSPNLLNLQNISNLFKASPTSVAQASSLASEEGKLIPDQVLFIPVTCGSTNASYFANVTYRIKKGDSFYLVSTELFQNLTDFKAVEEMNPRLDPIRLQIGTEVTIPIYCKCSRSETKFLITYVLQPGDDVQELSSLFKTSSDDIIRENSFINFKTALGLPVFIPVSKLPVLPQPRLKSKTGGIHLFLMILTSVIGSLAVLVLAAFLVYVRRKRSAGKPLARIDSSLIQMRKYLPHEKIGGKLLPGGLSGYLGNPITYEQSQILEATDNFSERFRIGGSVYKAMIKNELVAVKKTYEDSTEELKILLKLSHANLVKLKGASADINGSLLLVYEFAENGSLDKMLFTKSSSSKPMGYLTWRQRLRIALDVAHGLQYLHEHTQPSIVHGDIRTSNILLSSEFKAKISNFSSARPALNSVTPKMDIFGFGIILLELLSGKKNMEITTLSNEIRGVLDSNEDREERVKKWMDSGLNGKYPIEGAMSLAALAKACTVDISADRPSMNEIVFNLSVLAHSSSCSGTFECSWGSGVEGEDEAKMVIPVVAR